MWSYFNPLELLIETGAGHKYLLSIGSFFCLFEGRPSDFSDLQSPKSDPGGWVGQLTVLIEKVTKKVEF